MYIYTPLYIIYNTLYLHATIRVCTLACFCYKIPIVRWLPFAETVLQMVSELPSPKDAAPQRLPVLCPKWILGKEPNDPHVTFLLKFFLGGGRGEV